MALTASPRLAPRAELSLRARRPPGEYVALLSQSEREFRSYIDALERDPLFQKLVQDGAVVKVRLQGRIPREKYEAFMDRELVAFLREYGITQHPNWEKDLLAPHAIERAAESAERYGTPPGLMLRFLRYLRSVGADYTPMQRQREGEPAPDVEATVSGTAPIDLTETIERTREFVERYEVSEQEFLNCVLGGASVQALVERFGCSLLEAEELLEDTDRVFLAENWEFHPPGEAQSVAVAPADDTVASVRVEDDRLAVQFRHDSIYTQRYVIPAMPAGASDEAGFAHELLLRARYVNQRLSILSRLVQKACECQIEYLATGDIHRLKPLSQAELARQLGEHPSTVSRLMRGKKIETPHGTPPLSYLCQSKTDVVARLVAAFPQLTDQDVVSKLREEFDCHIARRTVAYHRAKRVRRNKRRKGATTSDQERPMRK